MALLLASPPGVAGAQRSLYDRMGGASVVQAVAGEVIDVVVARHDLGRSFADTNLERIKRLLAEQICSVAAGPCHYSGDSMREVHAGHQISEAEFYGMVEVLRDSLRHHGVPLRERNELLALLAPMQRDIVEPVRSPARAVR
jgi:hemoglobin